MIVFRLTLLAALCLSALSTRAAEKIPAKERITLLITIDGFPAWIWNDPSLAAPTLKKLAADGVVAGAMKVSNPSVTWPNHTTLVTGVPVAKHGVLFNGLLMRQGAGKPNAFEQWRDKSELIRVPTVYDAAFKAGLSTAHVDWIPTQKAGTFNWEFPERADPKGAVEQAMVAAGIVAQKDLDEWNKRNIVFHDEIWTRAGEFLIKQHKPNFLLFHLLTTDASNHKFGPGTLPSFSAYAYADSCIRRLLEAIDAAGLKDRCTIFITTDHGFKTAKKIIRPDAVLRKEELLKRAGPTVTHCDVISKSGGGYTMLYITDPAKKAELTARLKGIFEKIEGVANVHTPADYATLLLPLPTENEQVGDLYITAKHDYAFNDSFSEGEIVIDVSADPAVYPGHHGYPNDDAQINGIFIASGYGIKKGAALESMRNLDVAPTIARVLGIEMPNVDGKVLEEILEK